MQYEFANNLLTVNVSAIQAVALAVVTYTGGVWIRKKVPFFARYSVPSSVIGGMSLALVLSVLQYYGIMKVNFDSSLQTILMLAFFTTIGLVASLKIVSQGGILLVGFLISVTVLSVLQNLLGMGLADMMGLDFHYGILAGSVSMMGGLGTSAAFGPYFEQTYGIQGATAVAITAATFGMVAALLVGAPFGEWLIRRYKVRTPVNPAAPEPQLKIPEDMETDVDTDSHNKPTMTAELLKATGIVVICIALGSIVSEIMGKYITLPAYIGSMLVAAFVRNIGDFSGKFKVEGPGLNAVADISLVLFVTMAINSLKLHELVHLALPLVVILMAQLVMMIFFAWGFLFILFGKGYDAVMLCVGGIGFAMGSTANGLANMQAIAEKYGTSPKAWLIVSLVGAFLIDLINAILITWMGTW
jgi:ESS family glutamate:Na+ symporter